ncbi:unnamed protein product, partial [Meganyctiphanes norvegica]
MIQDYVGFKGGDCVTCGVKTTALRSEVEVLKRRLLDRDVSIVQLEAQMAQECPEAFPQGQVALLRAQCDHWEDKYDRLLEAHKRLQRVNQGLEDKLLRLVDRTESEKSKLTANTTSLTTALTTAAQAINRLKNENERYKNDLNLAIQLLQCNPSKYSTHKLDSLPSDLQKKAKTHLSKEGREPHKPEMKVIKVPIPSFPPTAMVYSVNKYTDQNKSSEPVDAVSAAIMAAVLEERQRERAQQHCSTCSCNNSSSRLTGRTDNDQGNIDEFTSACHPDETNRNNLFNNGFHSKGETERSNLKVKSALDIGTQTFPSYIGERGKVNFTCIYCEGQGGGSRGSSSISSNTSPASSSHSIRSSIAPITDIQYKNSLHDFENKANHSSYNNKSYSLLNNERLDNTGNKLQGGQITRTRQDSRSNISHVGSAWDWASTVEGHDSASPSTPSSLISASLSYESETSNITSPLNSPERLQDISSIKASPVSIAQYSAGNVGSSLSSKGKNSLKSYNYDIYSTDVTDRYKEKLSSVTGNICTTQISRIKNSTVVPVTQSCQISNNKSIMTGSPNLSKLPFNARSPYNDVFSPPIHRSPPLPGRSPPLREELDHSGADKNIFYGNIVSSTPTYSTTETTL